VSKLKLQWERAGTQNRKSLYRADGGVDSIDGGPATYFVFNEGGLWRGGGDNVRRAGGVMGHSLPEVKRKVEQIDQAARLAFEGGYSLTGDVVLAPGTRRA
jgi:hypothetical protein